MQTAKVTINGKGYTLTALPTGKVRRLTEELKEAQGDEEIFAVTSKYIMLSIRIEHPTIEDDFLDENTHIFEVQEIFQELMNVSSLKKSNDAVGKPKK